MGKGDRKTKKGKIIKGTFGVRRPKKRKANVAIPAKKKATESKSNPKKTAAKAKKTSTKEKVEAENKSA